MASPAATTMQPTSPAQPSEPESHSGFTLVEVLIALLIAVILVSVTASTLTLTLRAEDSLNLQESGEHIIQSLQTELYIRGSASNTIARFAREWIIVPTHIETGATTNRTTWNIWEVASQERPSVQWRFAHHINSPD